MLYIILSTGLAIAFGLYGLWVFMAVVICWILFSVAWYWEQASNERLFREICAANRVRPWDKPSVRSSRNHPLPLPSRKSSPSVNTDWTSDPSGPVFRSILFDTTSHSIYSGYSDGGSYSSDGGSYSGGDCGGGGDGGGGGSCD
jgi:uncharacterized membrane protein YgcG